MSIEKGITCSYTPGIYAEGYIAFVFRFTRSYVRSLLSVALVEFTSKFSVKAHWTQVSNRCPLGYLFLITGTFSIFVCGLLIIFQIYDNKDKNSQNVNILMLLLLNFRRSYTLVIPVTLHFPKTSLMGVPSYISLKIHNSYYTI